MAELGKLLGPRVTLQRPPEGTYGIPQVEHVAPPLSPNQLYEVGQNLCCPMGAISKPKFRDARKNVWISAYTVPPTRESLRAGIQQETRPSSNA